MTQSTLLKILWIEDQPVENDGFSRECKMEGFSLINAESAEDGIGLLKANPEGYSGIILDALGYKESMDEALNTAGLHYALREIRAIAPDIPKVVLTGQEQFVDDNGDFEEIVGVPIFYKQAENDPLYAELRKQIDTRPDAELRRRYPDICNLCDDEFLPAKKWSETLYPALKEAHEGTHNPDRFNGLRRVLEAALKSLALNGILPECFDKGGQINLNHCVRLLSGDSVTPHNQNKIHYYVSSALLDTTDQTRIQLLKILTSEESHENSLHRTVADLSCAVFTLISLLPSLKEISKKCPTWIKIDFSQNEYEIPGVIDYKWRFSSDLGTSGGLEIPQRIMENNRLQRKERIWVVCQNYRKGGHKVIDTRPLS